jgi:HK97 family phage prohead protease
MSTKFFNITNKSLNELGVETHQDLWNKVKGEYQGLSAEFPVSFETKKNDKDETEYTMVFSTPDEDRHYDVVLQDFDLKWYKKNPVVLDSHNYSSIAHIIGKVKNIRIEDGKLKGEIEFNMSNPKGVMAKEMVDNGFLNASSIGFIPKEFNEKGQIVKSELLENSLVSVPANARALFEKIAEEVKEEIATVEKEMEDETKEIEIAEIKTINKKKVLLNSIKTALQEMDAKELRNKKRELFKALRNL